MPRSQRSLQLTDRYRARLERIRARVDRTTKAAWRVSLEDLDSTYAPWLDVTVGAVSQAQIEGIRVTAGYLGAYLTLELGTPTRPPRIDVLRWAGQSRDGRPLADALLSPLIGTKKAIKDGTDPAQALATARSRAIRSALLDTDQASRFALLDTIASDDRIEGWIRSPKGTCGACLAVSGNIPSGELNFPVHPGCNCVSAPVIRGVRDIFPYAAGAAIFAAMTREAQDGEFGPEKADLLRSGAITLDDLHDTSPMATETDYLTEAPLGAVT